MVNLPENTTIIFEPFLYVNSIGVVFLEEKLVIIFCNSGELVFAINTPTTKNDLIALEEEHQELIFLIEEESKSKPMITREQLKFWLEQFQHGNYDDEKFRESLFDIFISQVYCYDNEYRVIANFKDGFKEFTKTQIDNIETEKGFFFERKWVEVTTLEQLHSPDSQGCVVFNCDGDGGDDGN